MKDKIFLEQNAQEVYNIIDALQFYKDNAVKPKFKILIDKQIQNVVAQIQLQGINIYKNDHEATFIFGEVVKYENKDAIIVQMSNEEGFVKVAIVDGESFKILDVPTVLISKEAK